VDCGSKIFNLELLTLGPASQRDSGWNSVTAVSSQMTPCVSARWTVRLGEAGSTMALGAKGHRAAFFVNFRSNV
jgi:hypothetical protein